MSHLLDYLDRLAALLAASTSFRQATGAADAAAALAHIHIYREDYPAAQAFLAVLADPATAGLEMSRELTGTGPAAFQGRRGARLVLIGRVESWSEEASAAFRASCGAILADLATLAGTASYPRLDRLAKVPSEGPAAYRWQDDTGPGYQLAFDLSDRLWGI